VISMYTTSIKSPGNYTASCLESPGPAFILSLWYLDCLLGEYRVPRVPRRQTTFTRGRLILRIAKSAMGLRFSLPKEHLET
jgi:hypothetical protein